MEIVRAINVPLWQINLFRWKITPYTEITLATLIGSEGCFYACASMVAPFLKRKTMRPSICTVAVSRRVTQDRVIKIQV